jgi:hypothetical protein
MGPSSEYWRERYQTTGATMTRRSISWFLLALGLIWGFMVVGLLALFGGFLGNAPPTNLALIGEGLLSVWWMFVGPLLMVIGSCLVIGDSHSRSGLILTSAACLILTMIMGYQIVQMFHGVDDPLASKPSFAFDAICSVAAVVTLLADAGAIKLSRSTTERNRTSV